MSDTRFSFPALVSILGLKRALEVYSTPTFENWRQIFHQKGLGQTALDGMLSRATSFAELMDLVLLLRPEHGKSLAMNAVSRLNQCLVGQTEIPPHFWQIVQAIDRLKERSVISNGLSAPSWRFVLERETNLKHLLRLEHIATSRRRKAQLRQAVLKCLHEARDHDGTQYVAFCQALTQAKNSKLFYPLVVAEALMVLSNDCRDAEVRGCSETLRIQGTPAAHRALDSFILWRCSRKVKRDKAIEPLEFIILLRNRQLCKHVLSKKVEMCLAITIKRLSLQIDNTAHWLSLLNTTESWPKLARLVRQKMFKKAKMKGDKRKSAVALNLLLNYCQGDERKRVLQKLAELVRVDAQDWVAFCKRHAKPQLLTALKRAVDEDIRPEDEQRFIHDMFPLTEDEKGELRGYILKVELAKRTELVATE